MTTLSSKQAAAEALAPIDWLREFDLSLEAAEAIVILGPNQRSIDARGADLEHIGASNRIGDIEKSRYGMADLCAGIDRHRLVIEPLGHYLKCWTPTAGDDHPDKAVAHGFERRLDRLRDAMGVNQ